MAFVIRFTVEKDQPVARPLYVAWVRNRNFGSYVGADYKITDDVATAQQWANAGSAQRWADQMSHTDAEGSVIYRYEIEETNA